jgi:putative RNA 2'-phosphotransferase
MSTRSGRVEIVVANLAHLSKFLSLVLRHKPETIGLHLDAEGWADVDAMIVKARTANVELNADIIREIVRTSDKQRFKLSDDGRRIRANQGHSINVDLSLSPATPPEQLYHGTAAKTVAAILDQGLKKMSRQHVHLSLDADTARKVGRRHGKAVVLTVAAVRMVDDGHVFFRSENGVWLTDHVPARFIEFPTTTD